MKVLVDSDCLIQAKKIRQDMKSPTVFEPGIYAPADWLQLETTKRETASDNAPPAIYAARPEENQGTGFPTQERHAPVCGGACRELVMKLAQKPVPGRDLQW